MVNHSNVHPSSSKLYCLFHFIRFSSHTYFISILAQHCHDHAKCQAFTYVGTEYTANKSIRKRCFLKSKIFSDAEKTYGYGLVSGNWRYKDCRGNICLFLTMAGLIFWLVRILVEILVQLMWPWKRKVSWNPQLVTWRSCGSPSTVKLFLICHLIWHVTWTNQTECKST